MGWKMIDEVNRLRAERAAFKRALIMLVDHLTANAPDVNGADDDWREPKALQHARKVLDRYCGKR
jgi:hypothetical protein